MRKTIGFPIGSKKKKVFIEKNGKNWCIDFSIEQQTFRLDTEYTKEEAEWMAKQLRHALNKLKFK